MAQAEPSIIQRVTLEPLQGGISFNSICFNVSDEPQAYKCWVTAPSVSMRGRKELMIINTSTSANVYCSNVSGDTAHMVELYPRETFTFKASSSLNIYMSANSVVTVNTVEIR